MEGIEREGLDDVDRRILNALQLDASQNNADLAKLLGISPPTCLRRVKRMAEAGYIEKQVAIVAPAMVGVPLTAIAEVTLDKQAFEHLEQFERHVGGDEAVLQCYRVTSGPDFILVLQVADMSAYHAVAHRLFGLDANVRNVRCFFSTFRSKFETRIVL
jgi:Lrp/AsnC family leucine-responsive transcriptional regulator